MRFVPVARRGTAALLLAIAPLSAPGQSEPQTRGVEHNLPVFAGALAERLTFPMSWLSGRYTDYPTWRAAARARILQTLLAPPPAADFRPVTLAEEDRGTYVARRLALDLTGDSRVTGLLLVPKAPGPHPAVLLLHDHGARFDIGKEKMIRPLAADPARQASAREWSERNYAGRFVGDELAKRGFVCFATDALNWSDRGGAGYEGQQALASNLMHLGASLAGLIAHEDTRAADFLASLPEVDARHVAAVGHSWGGFRAWQLAALSDRVAAAVAVCWMGTVRGMMRPGQNQTRGQSAFTMLHPGLFAEMDYPDVASVACPKPLLVYNGRQDPLAAAEDVERAYAKLRSVWESQGAGGRLVVKLWDAGHVFDLEMQEAAFSWLEARLGSGGAP